MAGPTVGLDIGSNQIKAVEMRRSGSGLQVASLGVAPTPQAAYENGVIVDAQALGQAVKELLRRSGISARQCVSSVSGQAVVVRVIEVPRMSVTELAETMKWEVQRQIPFPADEVIVDYQPIERAGDAADGQNMDVLLAVAQQDMIDRHVSMLFAAGLKPVAIDVEPMAAARCLMDFTGVGAPGHTVAVVNIGASNTDICIFRDKLPSFNRTLPLAGDNLTHAIAAALQVDTESAEKYKKEYGEVMLGQMQQSAPTFGDAGGPGGFIDFTTPSASAPPTGPATPSGAVTPMPFDFSTEAPAPTPSEATAFDLSGNPIPPADASVPGGGPFMAPEQGFMAPTAPPPPSNLPAPASGSDLSIQVFNAMSPVLVDLAQELRRSIDFYRGKVADGQIHELQLIGGTARLRNLAPYLESELGIPARVVNPFQLASVVSKNFSAAQTEELASLFPVSMGLGAYQMVSSTAGGKKR